MNDNLLVCVKNSISPELYEDLEKRLHKLEQENREYKTLYTNACQRSYELDYTVYDQKKALENTRKTLECYEKENKALRELIRLWI